MCLIPLYYTVSAAPHSNQPQASTLSGCSQTGSKAAWPPELKFESLTQPLFPPDFEVSSPSILVPRSPCSPHTCAFRKAGPSSWNASRSGPPPAGQNPISLQAKCRLVASSIGSTWFHHQTAFFPWRPALRTFFVALIFCLVFGYL